MRWCKHLVLTHPWPPFPPIYQQSWPMTIELTTEFTCDNRANPIYQRPMTIELTHDNKTIKALTQSINRDDPIFCYSKNTKKKKIVIPKIWTNDDIGGSLNLPRINENVIK